MRHVIVICCTAMCDMSHAGAPCGCGPARLPAPLHAHMHAPLHAHLHAPLLAHLHAHHRSNKNDGSKFASDIMRIADLLPAKVASPDQPVATHVHACVHMHSTIFYMYSGGHAGPGRYGCGAWTGCRRRTGRRPGALHHRLNRHRLNRCTPASQPPPLVGVVCP